jgi:dipeptide/tripeptide permease
MALANDMNSTAASGKKERTLFGHPVGLYVLFFTEMWERFSYYGMRALLMLYMLNYFKWTQENASMVYKWYTSLVYLTPLIGGYLADRYLGNRRAVIIGAVLMAIGHFLMAFEAFSAFFSALIFLIIGNGFFKPNMSTQVGRLYPQNDGRRDGAYTIFYMGINLGAFLSPLICGWLAANTLGKYHSGFTAAGIGMVCGLLVYVLGMRWVIELDPSGKPVTLPEQLQQEESAVPVAAGPGGEKALSEAAAEHTPSVVPGLNRLAPRILAGIGVLLAISGPLLALPFVGVIAWNTMIAMEIAAVCFLIGGWILSQVHHAERDRVLAIYALGIFVVFFWGGFEQGGNVLNLWADKYTDRYLTTEAKPPDIYPQVAENGEVEGNGEEEAGFWEHWTSMFQLVDKTDKKASKSTLSWWESLWNPVATEWFQSINSLAIFLLAPLFAYLWTALDRRGLNPSIPTKMAIGVLLMSLSFGLMVAAAKRENRPSAVSLQRGERLPEAIQLNDLNQLSFARDDNKTLQPYLAGRLTFDPDTRTLHMTGVLPDLDRDRIVRATAPKYFRKKVEDLQKKANSAEGRKFRVSVKLDKVPPGFDMKYAGFPKKAVSFNEKTKELTATIRLADKDVKNLLVAGGDPQFRNVLNQLMIESSQFRVSPMWLFWFYILGTFGELCLSPVGLSMVSKLAPARFATMLMGLWLLTSFFGNFAAGAMGEMWGIIAPTPYFFIFVVVLGGASVVLFLLVRKVVATMHGVN